MAKNNQSSRKKKVENGSAQKSSGAMQKGGTAGADVGRRENAPWSGSPFTFMRRFSEEMDRLFEDFGFGRGWLASEFERGLDQLGTLAGSAWAPQVHAMACGSDEFLSKPIDFDRLEAVLDHFVPLRSES